MILLTTRGIISGNPTSPTPNHLQSSTEAQQCTANGKAKNSVHVYCSRKHVKIQKWLRKPRLSWQFFIRVCQTMHTKLKILAQVPIIEPQNIVCQNFLNKVWFLWKHASIKMEFLKYLKILLLLLLPSLKPN